VEIPPLLPQTAGSLAAILALAGLAWWLKLGGAPLLNDDTEVRRAAGEIEDGFVPVDCAISDDQTAALALGTDLRMMLIRRHGNRFAGRILGPAASARLTCGALEVDCGEPRFGKTFLTIPDPAPWAEAINRVSEPHHA